MSNRHRVVVLTLLATGAASCVPGEEEATATVYQEIAGCDPLLTCAESEVVGLDVGGDFSCGLRADGRVRCWGANGSGQLGDGTTTPRAREVEAAGLTKAASLDLGTTHACAVDRSQRVWCWGSNLNGQLGDGTTVTRSTPTRTAGTMLGASVSAGGAHSCAVSTTGAVWCWGANTFGQLGDGTTTARPSPTNLGVTATAVTAGDAHTCALLSTGAVRCWGRNTYGQLGDGTTTHRSSPVTVSGITNAVEIRAGSEHTCARLATGAVRCWGANGSGQLGDGTFTSRATPVTVASVADASTLTAGRGHTCASSDAYAGAGGAKVVWCWGYNSDGQLGDGTTTRRSTAARRTVNYPTRRVAAGSSHTCSLDRDGQVLCWGRNASGQLGEGGRVTGSLTPIVSDGAGQVLSIETARDYNLMWPLAFDGRVMSVRPALATLNPVPWATTTTDSLTYVENSTAFPSGTVQVAHAASSPVFARRSDGTVWATGESVSIANASALTASSFAPVAGLAGVTQVVAGNGGWGAVLSSGAARFTLRSTGVTTTLPLSGVRSLALSAQNGCALLATGNVYCWGSDPSGTTTPVTAPVLVAGVTGATQATPGPSGTMCALLTGGAVRCWTGSGFGTTAAAVAGVDQAEEITSGSAHACARIADGTVRCWGANDRGQRGLGHVGAVTSSATTVSYLDRVRQVRAGLHHTCALRVDGSVRCWGNAIHQDAYRWRILGDGSADVRGKAVDVFRASGVRAARSPSASGTSTRLLSAAGTLSYIDRLGRGPVVEAGYSALVDVATGSGSLCAAATTGRVLCAGRNDNGQLGLGTTGAGYTTAPSEVLLVRGATAVAAGNLHLCALAGNEVWCWGANSVGQVGNGATGASVPTPTRVLTGAAAISAGGDATCALLTTGRVRCWGRGVVTPTEPAAMAGTTALSLAVGGFSCAVLSGRTLRCWEPSAPSAATLASFTHVSRASVGGSSVVCAVRTDGTVACLQNGVFAARSDITGAVDLSVGVTSAHVVLSDGRVRTFGTNEWSSLGDGSPDFAVYPRPFVFGP